MASIIVCIELREFFELRIKGREWVFSKTAKSKEKDKKDLHVGIIIIFELHKKMQSDARRQK